MKQILVRRIPVEMTSEMYKWNDILKRSGSRVLCREINQGLSGTGSEKES